MAAVLHADAVLPVLVLAGRPNGRFGKQGLFNACQAGGFLPPKWS